MPIRLPSSSKATTGVITRSSARGAIPPARSSPVCRGGCTFERLLDQQFELGVRPHRSDRGLGCIRRDVRTKPELRQHRSHISNQPCPTARCLHVLGTECVVGSALIVFPAQHPDLIVAAAFCAWNDEVGLQKRRRRAAAAVSGHKLALATGLRVGRTSSGSGNCLGRTCNIGAHFGSGLVGYAESLALALADIRVERTPQ